jgi:hypothetical protein
MRYEHHQGQKSFSECPISDEILKKTKITTAIIHFAVNVQTRKKDRVRRTALACILIDDLTVIRAIKHS